MPLAWVALACSAEELVFVPAAEIEGATSIYFFDAVAAEVVERDGRVLLQSPWEELPERFAITLLEYDRTPSELFVEVGPLSSAPIRPRACELLRPTRIQRAQVDFGDPSPWADAGTDVDPDLATFLAPPSIGCVDDAFCTELVRKDFMLPGPDHVDFLVRAGDQMLIGGVGTGTIVEVTPGGVRVVEDSMVPAPFFTAARADDGTLFVSSRGVLHQGRIGGPFRALGPRRRGVLAAIAAAPDASEAFGVWVDTSSPTARVVIDHFDGAGAVTLWDRDVEDAREGRTFATWLGPGMAMASVGRDFLLRIEDGRVSEVGVAPGLAIIGFYVTVMRDVEGYGIVLGANTGSVLLPEAGDWMLADFAVADRADALGTYAGRLVAGGPRGSVSELEGDRRCGPRRLTDVDVVEIHALGRGFLLGGQNPNRASGAPNYVTLLEPALN